MPKTGVGGWPRLLVLRPHNSLIGKPGCFWLSLLAQEVSDFMIILRAEARKRSLLRIWRQVYTTISFLSSLLYMSGEGDSQSSQYMPKITELPSGGHGIQRLTEAPSPGLSPLPLSGCCFQKPRGAEHPEKPGGDFQSRKGTPAPKSILGLTTHTHMRIPRRKNAF